MTPADFLYDRIEAILQHKKDVQILTISLRREYKQCLGELAKAA